MTAGPLALARKAPGRAAARTPRRIGNSFASVPRNARGCGCFGSVSGASRYDRSWPRLRARHTSGLMANNAEKSSTDKWLVMENGMQANHSSMAAGIELASSFEGLAHKQADAASREY